MSTDYIETSIGRVPVLHRLALGIVLRDAVTTRVAVGPFRVGWEATQDQLPPGSPPEWPCVDFEPAGQGRFRLRVGPRGSAPLSRFVQPVTSLTVRIDDPSRRYVPRRLSIPLWSYPEVIEQPPSGPLAVGSRTVEVWLWPGAASPVPRGVTAIRGRVVRQQRPVPWTRITATGPTGAVIGRAHGDDRGEFLLRLTSTTQNPVQSTVAVRALVRGPVALPKPPGEPPEPPPVETVTRPANPPVQGGPVDHVLFGHTPPAGHVRHLPPPLPFTIPVGRVTVPAADFPFAP